ncbi:MAG: RNA polymerase sigma factor [Vicinamibacterales bacterium]
MLSRAERIWAARVELDWTVTVVGDDRELARAAVAGDREAFGLLVERHRRTIFQLCYRFVGRQEEARDLAQDVFVRAWRGLRGFKEQSAFSTWLYRIGVNVCLNRVTAKSPRLDEMEPLDDAPRGDPRGADPAEGIDRGRRAATVRAAIAKLPPKQRATLVLRVYHELSHERIAEILGSSVGASKANFFHALANLKKLLEQP